MSEKNFTWNKINNTFIPQPLVMQSFEISITVSKDDLDSLNHVNNVRYVQWVQDVAEQHWMVHASDTIRSEYFWVLLKHTIEYKNPSYLGDALRLKTYILKSGGVTCVRKVEIYNDNSSKLLAASETTWCLMSQKTEKPARITDEIRALFT